MTHDVVLECPKCGKDGLVRLESRQDVFECVYCRYKDDLNTDGNDTSANDKSVGGFGLVLFLCFTLALAVMLF